MKITGLDLIVLLRTTEESLRIGDNGAVFGYSAATRQRVCTNVLTALGELTVEAKPVAEEEVKR